MNKIHQWINRLTILHALVICLTLLSASLWVSLIQDKDKKELLQSYADNDCREALLYFNIFVKDDWIKLERHWTEKYTYDELLEGADGEWEAFQAEALKGVDKYAVYTVAEFFAEGQEIFGLACMKRLFFRKAQNHLVYHFPIIRQMDVGAGTDFINKIHNLYP